MNLFIDFSRHFKTVLDILRLF